ncbi:hypothetical protein D3C72_2431620 [compost metagenome]
MPSSAYSRMPTSTMSVCRNSRAFIVRYPMPACAEMVSATIRITHINPSENRSPTRMLESAPGRMICR